MIFSIFSDGDWIWVLKKGTVNSEDFIKFLLVLEAYLSKWKFIDIRSTWVTLDNATIHISRKTKFAAYHLNYKLNFLPPYSPTLAPVELIFGVLKRKIAHKRRSKSIDFGKKSGEETIIDAIKTMPHRLGIKLWIRFINEAKRWVIKWKEKQTLVVAV